jgi:ABC-2 type transport system ATP-binding protein
MPVEALLARDVRKTYRTRGAPEVEALSGVSMVAHPGERVALLGRNGAGKTTFLKIASTLLSATSGTVEVLGHDAVRDPDSVRPLIAVVPQEGKPFFHLTPREQVYTYLRSRGLDRRTANARTAEALGEMGLTEVADRLSITLSGGQRQRTMVATVIATQAPVLFLDEPTIGMDPFARRAVWQTLRRLSRQGCTILLTTHYLDEADALSERLYIVERGRVLVEGTAASLKQQLGGSLRVSFPGAQRMVTTFQGYGRVVTDGETVHVLIEPPALTELLNLAVREHLTATVGPVTLEEAFLSAVGHSIDED